MHSIYSPLQPPRSLAGIKFVLFFPCSHFCILWALYWEVSLLSPRFSDELRCRYIDRGGLAEQQSIYIQSQQDNLQHLMKEVRFSLNTERVLLLCSHQCAVDPMPAFWNSHRQQRHYAFCVLLFPFSTDGYDAICSIYDFGKTYRNTSSPKMAAQHHRCKCFPSILQMKNVFYITIILTWLPDLFLHAACQYVISLFYCGGIDRSTWFICWQLESKKYVQLQQRYRLRTPVCMICFFSWR